MDSGNSSSMQSSSGGGGEQEEYDSRADQSISALFNNNNATTTGQTQLDSLIANYFNTGWSTDNPLWSTTTTKPTDGSTQPPLVFFTNPQDLRVVSNTDTSSPISSVPTDKKNGLAVTTRVPKKRSRVSRRAPTTVLTTDTSNFKAMVQEFTGSPSNPFTGLSSSSSSPFPRSRFDLFAPSSSSQPLKPFPHRMISPPSTDYHQSLLHSMNMQTIANPFLNSQSLRTSNGFEHVDVGTNFVGLHNVIASSSSSMTQPTLSTMHGFDKNSETDSDPLRSISGGEQYMVQRSDGYTLPVASGSESNLAAVRNKGHMLNRRQ
ncbi:unnamed protein product [Eruca vesicaria subsp. sativa]|uniref:VQ domain-containing protein n=1 Tax=Eruca vesicaria subsp. sativa TaxID=29727 RepID=A0ABC8JD17_ERUVS|nr:unnamed protein product [Eruca vesicaria subsp. sativa]